MTAAKKSLLHPVASSDANHNRRLSLRSALGRFATGVTVICAQTPDQIIHCMTVNSFSSLSLDPPLILWSLRTHSARYATFSSTSAFSVSVLSENQVHLARQHATPPSQGHDITQQNWNAFMGGCPIIEGASAHFICNGHTEVRKGDHVILIGEVTEFAEYTHPPLVFMSGKYYSSSHLSPL